MGAWCSALCNSLLHWRQTGHWIWRMKAHCTETIIQMASLFSSFSCGYMSTPVSYFVGFPAQMIIDKAIAFWGLTTGVRTNLFYSTLWLDLQGLYTAVEDLSSRAHGRYKRFSFKNLQIVASFKSVKTCCKEL